METTHSQRHARTREVFLAVCDLPDRDRDVALSLACGDDTDLLTSVRLLLTGEKDTTFLATSVVIRTEDAHLPEQVGEYRIIGLLGRGGTAVVYEAQQERPRRRVALKVLRSVWASPSMVKRLELEGEALGRLQHAGIAAVYGVGTAEGSPYLAMELVRGVALTRYAKGKDLGLRAKLELFASVCDAVQHAHQRGVIHRDLKPGNILVDEEGRAKIVDFGVARLGELDPQRTMHTEAGSVVGTLAYMSPEQAAGDVQQIDARTDVYSLGAVLYELLSGQTPLATAGVPVASALLAIREQPAASLGKSNRAFRGDLEVIAAKALEKEPQRRYQAASDLATDIRRHLSSETILARPPSTLDQLRKLAHRNRTVVAAGAVIAVLTVAAAVLFAWQWQRSARAVRRLTRAQESIQEMLGGQGRVSAELPSSFVATLDRAVKGVPAIAGDDPLAEADLRRIIGLAYNAAGRDPEGAAQLEVVYKLRSNAFGAASDEALESLEELGRVQANFIWADPRMKSFLESMKGLVAARTAGWGEEDPRTLRAEAVLAKAEGMDRTGLWAQSHQRFERILPKMTKTLGATDIVTLRTTRDFVDTLEIERQFGLAIPLLEGVLAAETARFGESSPEVIDTLLKLGMMIRGQRRYEDAVATYQRAVDLADAHLSDDYVLRWDTHHYLGRTLTDLGRLSEADKHLRLAFEHWPRSQDIRGAFEECLGLEGKWKEAEDLNVANWPSVNAWTDYPDMRSGDLFARAWYITEQGNRAAEAASLLREGEDILRVGFPGATVAGTSTAMLLITKGRVAMKAGDSATAETLLVSAMDELTHRSTQRYDFLDRRMGHRAIKWLQELSSGAGTPEQVERWRRLDERWQARELRGRNEIHAGRFELAEGYLVPRLAEHRQFFGDTDPRTIDVARTLVELYRTWERPEQADPYVEFLTRIGAGAEDDLMK